MYVKVTCYGVGNQYKIRSNYYATEGWEKESNDTMALATDLTAGKTLHGSINSKKDVDYYRYVATGSGYFNFKFTNADGGNNQYWKLSVYDEKKNTASHARNRVGRYGWHGDLWKLHRERAFPFWENM